MLDKKTIKILKIANWILGPCVIFMLSVSYFAKPVTAAKISSIILAFMVIIYVVLISFLPKSRIKLMLFVVPAALIGISIPLSKYREREDRKDGLQKMAEFQDKLKKKRDLRSKQNSSFGGDSLQKSYTDELTKRNK